NGLTPSAYRSLRSGNTFTITLPKGYPLPYLRRALSRDTQSVTDRLIDDEYTAVVQLSRGPAILKLHLASDKIHGEVKMARASSPPSPASAGETPALPVAIEGYAIVIGL